MVGEAQGRGSVGRSSEEEEESGDEAARWGRSNTKHRGSGIVNSAKERWWVGQGEEEERRASG